MPRFALWNLLKARTALRFGSPSDRTDLLDALGLPSHWHVLGYKSARAALLAWFRKRAELTGARVVVMSINTYPAVARLLEPLGFRARFVDLDSPYPCPGQDRVLQAAIEEHEAGRLAAIIIAPAFGYSPLEWTRLAKLGHDVPIVLDLAQGLGLTGPLAQLLHVAAATVFSFSLGKGLDTGGGLLAGPDLGIRQRNIWPLPLDTVANGTGLRFMHTLGSRRISAYAHDALLEERDPVPYERNYMGDAVDPRAFLTWTWALRDLDDDIRRARDYAIRLFERPAIREHCSHQEVFASTDQSHLRQLLRLKLPEQRDPLVESLNAAGVCTTPVKLHWPGEYRPVDEERPAMSADERAAAAPEHFPIARDFESRSVQLPFLGRVDERRFAELCRALDAALARPPRS